MKMVTYIIHGTSMLPMIQPGDEVVTDEAFPYSGLKVDDVVVFRHPKERDPVAHQIIEAVEMERRKFWLFGPIVKRWKEYVTKGINNPHADSGLMGPTRYIGKVKYAGGKAI